MVRPVRSLRFVSALAGAVAVMLVGCSPDGSDGSGANAAATDAAVVRELGAPSGVIREEFTWPRHVVELADGRAIVSDPRDGDVYVVDFETGERTLFGSKGDGPGEYRSPAAVLRYSADTVMVIGAGSPSRVSVLTTDGVPARTVLIDATRFPLTDAAAPARSYSEWPPEVIASDGAGRLYGERPRLPADMEPVPAADNDRVLVRFALDGAAVDTIVRVAPTAAMSARPTASGLEMDLPLGPFEMSHAWTVLADGTVAVVDEHTFELVLYLGDAAPSRVGVVPHSLTPLDAAIWESFVDSTRAALMESLQGAPVPATVLVPPAPTTLPPVFATDQRRLLTDGEQLWVPVPGAAPFAQETWQVLDRDGRTLHRYLLPARTRLIAVSERYLYTSLANEDGLQQLQRLVRDGAGN